MKKIIFASLLSILSVYAFGQEQGKIRGNVGLGAAIPSGGAGFLFNLEGNYNVADNISVGVRVGWAVMAKNIESDAGGNATKADVGANASYLATGDYFFTTGSSFTPFLGAGLGYYNLANVSIEDGDNVDKNGIDASGKFGFLVRGGFEVGKFRLTAEYDIVSKTDIENVEGEVVGDVPNSYFGISLGVFFGGGRW